MKRSELKEMIVEILTEDKTYVLQNFYEELRKQQGQLKLAGFYKGDIKKYILALMKILKDEYNIKPEDMRKWRQTGR